MIDFGCVDELREIRRRLSEECGNDVHRYAEMLREMASKSKAKYITAPLKREEVPPIVSREDPGELPMVPPASPTPAPERIG